MMGVDLTAFSQATQRVLNTSDVVSSKAKTFDQKGALAQLGPNPLNGEYYRFDERIEEAMPVAGKAPSAPPSRCAAGCIHFEFDESDTIPLLYTGEHRVEDGLMKLKYQKKRYLFTQIPVHLDKDAVGEIQIRMRNTTGREAELMWQRTFIEGITLTGIKG
jgi:hypothetical protein